MSESTVAPALERVSRAWVRIGPRAQEVLCRLAERLALGAPYGDFGPGREWKREAGEEYLDGAIYMVAATLPPDTSMPPAPERRSTKVVGR